MPRSKPKPKDQGAPREMVHLARLMQFADSTLPVFVPAVVAGYEERVVTAALTHLLDDAGCDAVSLSPLSGESAVARAAERSADSPKMSLVRSDSPGPHTVFRFPATFDDYLASLSKSQRQNHRRYLCDAGNSRRRRQDSAGR